MCSIEDEYQEWLQEQNDKNLRAIYYNGVEVGRETQEQRDIADGTLDYLDDFAPGETEE